MGNRASRIVVAVLIALGGMTMTVTVTDSPVHLSGIADVDLRTTAGDAPDGDVTWGP
jgi:hypothetical protein